MSYGIFIVHILEQNAPVTMQSDHNWLLLCMASLGAGLYSLLNSTVSNMRAT